MIQSFLQPGVIKLAWALTVCITVSATAVQAQPAAPPTLSTRSVLTLTDSIDRGLGISPDLRSSRAGIDIAQGDVITSRLPSRFNPGINFEGGPRFDSSGGSIGPQLGITLGQELERPDRRAAREQVASLGVQVEQIQLQAARLRIEQRIRNLYAQFWLNDQLFKLAVEREKLAERSLGTLQERYKVGDISLIPVNLAQVEFSQARALRERQEGEVGAGRASLLVAIGETPERAVDPELDLPATPPSLPPLARIFELVLEANPTLLATETERTRSEAQIRLAQAEATPNLTPLVGYRREGPEDVVIAGLSVPINLFNRNEGAIASAQARREQVSAQRDLRTLELRIQIEEAYARFTAAQRVLATFTGETLNVIERNTGLVEEGFRAGKTGVTEVLLARRDGLAARASFYQARADVYTSFVQLQTATGGRL